MRALSTCLLFVALSACSGGPPPAAPSTPAAPAAPAPPTPPPPPPEPPEPPASSDGTCHSDADCIAVDECGCNCRPTLRPGPPVICSVVCGPDACAGQHAVCRDGHCVLAPAAPTPTPPAGS